MQEQSSLHKRLECCLHLLFRPLNLRAPRTEHGLLLPEHFTPSKPVHPRFDRCKDTEIMGDRVHRKGVGALRGLLWYSCAVFRYSRGG